MTKLVSVLVLAAGLLPPGLASAQGPSPQRQEFSLPATKARGLPLSDAVLVGDTLYIAGRGGVDLATMQVPKDLKDEVRLMMDDYKAILAMAGMTMDDLVSVTVYCPDLKLYAEFNEIYRTYFTKAFPARAFVGSGPLLFGMRFEMVGVAVKRAVAPQQPLDWAKDDAARIATLQRDGSKLEGEHAILWFPPSLSRPDAEALLKRLEPGVAGLWKRVGTHAWQAVRKGPITYYLSDDTFVSHASGRAAVFISMSRVRDGRAPYLHEATHELLASTRRGGPPPIPLRPLWLTEGLPDYIARLVAADLGTTESGPFDVPMISSADALCAERSRTADGGTMLRFIGSTQRPEVLFTTDRARFAPTFYTCSLSFVNYLVERVELATLIALFDVEPAETIARLDQLRGKTIAGWRAEWLQHLKLN